MLACLTKTSFYKIHLWIYLYHKLLILNNPKLCKYIFFSLKNKYRPSSLYEIINDILILTLFYKMIVAKNYVFKILCN